MSAFQPVGLLGPERYGYVRLDCLTPYRSWIHEKHTPSCSQRGAACFKLLNPIPLLISASDSGPHGFHLIIILRTPPVQRFPFLYTPPVRKMLKKISLSASHTRWSQHMSDTSLRNYVNLAIDSPAASGSARPNT